MTVRDLELELERAGEEFALDRELELERLRLTVELEGFLIAREEELRLTFPSRDSAREGLRLPVPLRPTLDFKARLETKPLLTVRADERFRAPFAFPARALSPFTT